MILLDTNVLSEFMRPIPAHAVATWLDEQSGDEVWTSAVSRAEIELGLALLPDGRRKQKLQQFAQIIFAQNFAGRCLSFDEQAACNYASLVAQRKRGGRPISVEDAQIAAIALTHGLTLATRNVRDFEQISGLTVVNPWLQERA